MQLSGPNKSGSTYLQTLLANPKPRQILAKDNYRFLGKCSWLVNQFEGCLLPKIRPFTETKNKLTGIKEYTIAPLLNTNLNELKEKNMNGLIILESACSPSYIHGFRQLIPDFDIHIISTYRRLYEFLPSAYSQSIKEFYEKPPLNDSDLVEPIPFDYFNESQLENVLPIYANFFRPLVERDMNHRFKQNMDRARMVLQENATYSVLNFHTREYDDYESSSLLLDLVCSNVVPGTNQTCQAAKENQFKNEPVKANNRVDAAYFTLALRAYKEKLIHDRPFSIMVAQIQNYFMDDEEYDQIPKTCMSNENLQKLHDLSWKHEQIIRHGGVRAENDVNEHRKGFEEYTAKGKFCSLDVDAMMKIEKWRAKISSMNLVKK